jgi:two-component system heavy metal sensor histidine kinase CusS
MPFGQLRRLFPTLRIRLVLWLTAVVLLLVIVTFVMVQHFFGRAIRSDFNQKLLSDLAAVKSDLAEFHDEEDKLHTALNKKVHTHPFQQWFVEIFDDRGGIIWSTPAAPKLPAFNPEKFGSLLDDGEFRYVDARIQELGKMPRIVRVGSSRASLEDDLEILGRSLLFLSIFILVLAPAGGFLLVSQATRPIQWIISTAQRLQPAKLDERLPVRDTGDELDQLSTTINTLLDRIAHYIASQQDFVANAAHELRSPLAAIRSSVEVGLGRARTTEEYVELLDMVVQECGRLSTLVNQLLLLAEGDAGKLDPGKSVAWLDRIVRETKEMFDPVAEAKEVTIVAENLPPVMVHGDENRLRQVIRNLIDNAIKFNKPGGEIRVRLDAIPRRQEAVLRIADTGIGIPLEEKERLFRRFYRADKSRHRGGSGLGLSICEAIISSSGGSIECDSRPGHGTEFIVTLQLAPDRVAVKAAN